MAVHAKRRAGRRGAAIGTCSIAQASHLPCLTGQTHGGTILGLPPVRTRKNGNDDPPSLDARPRPQSHPQGVRPGGEDGGAGGAGRIAFLPRAVHGSGRRPGRRLSRGTSEARDTSSLLSQAPEWVSTLRPLRPLFLPRIIVAVSQDAELARIVPRSDHPISRGDIDNNAIKVLYRLHKAGYMAYLVGGGVRDLMLGRRPKDFDVGTDARPNEVRRLFGNSRIIGRRFRLVHVYF
ncbi:MAG: hypothetical protein JOZ15_06800, partial [Acidobacteria bacterium]|nr:hypothetical protein [Acidobacteriota bacterium]